MTRSALKYWAIFAMLIDHIAWIWFPDTQLTGQLMHVIGRTTAPVMCFFIAEGYAHTRNFNRYLVRLLIFAAVSFVPFIWFENFMSFSFPVMWTLACGLLAIRAWDKIRSVPLRLLAVLGLCVAAMFGDWMFLGVLMCLGFWIFRNSRVKQSLSLAVVAVIGFAFIALVTTGFKLPESGDWRSLFAANWYQLATVLVIPLLFVYNGEKGKSGGKWLFYIFYPAHLLILSALRDFVFRL